MGGDFTHGTVSLLILWTLLCYFLITEMGFMVKWSQIPSECQLLSESPSAKHYSLNCSVLPGHVSTLCSPVTVVYCIFCAQGSVWRRLVWCQHTSTESTVARTARSLEAAFIKDDGVQGSTEINAENADCRWTTHTKLQALLSKD